MKKKLLVLLVTLTTLFSGAGTMLFVAPVAVMAQPKQAACDGLALAGGSCDPVAGQPTVESTLAVVINIFSWVVGIAGVIMIIIGGFKYITSGGNEQSVNSAKNTILFAIIGLVIVAIAQIIVQFVISEATAPPPQPTP